MEHKDIILAFIMFIFTSLLFSDILRRIETIFRKNEDINSKLIDIKEQNAKLQKQIDTLIKNSEVVNLTLHTTSENVKTSVETMGGMIRQATLNQTNNKQY